MLGMVKASSLREKEAGERGRKEREEQEGRRRSSVSKEQLLNRSLL
jgi:hypothetical protein